MSARRTKKLKKFILPLTFVVGLASFPLGQFLFHQSKKAATSVGLLEEKNQRKPVATKSQKRSHKIARNKVKAQKKIARARSKPKRERYAH